MVQQTASAVTANSATEHGTGRAQSGDVELFYRSFGAPGRSPVLIAHGMSYFSYDWVEVAATLATDREIVALDQRGFGESGWSPARDYSVTAFAGDMINLLDHLGWRRAVLMGHSMGGRNAAFCAAENPARVAGLVLVDWSPQTAPEGSQRVRAQNSGLPDAFASADEAVAYFVKDPALRSSPRVRARFDAFLRPVDGGYAIKRDTFFSEQSRAAVAAGRAPGLVSDRKRLDMWEVLKRIECPVLVVRGTRSDMFAAETADKVISANPMIRLVEIESGHDVAGDNPEALVAEVRSFIADAVKEAR